LGILCVVLFALQLPSYFVFRSFPDTWNAEFTSLCCWRMISGTMWKWVNQDLGGIKINSQTVASSQGLGMAPAFFHWLSTHQSNMTPFHCGKKLV
jgi:hypothetical protein